MKTAHRLIASLVLALTPCFFSLGQSPPTNGLIAYYPFDGSANDASGNGNDPGTVLATLAPDRFGRPSSSMAFDGSNSYILVTNFFHRYNNAPLTESLWFCPSNTFNVTNYSLLLIGGTALSDNSGGNQLISTFGREYFDTLGGPFYGLSAYTYLTNYPNDRFFAVAPPGVFQSNVWVNVVAVYTETNNQIYLNGVLQRVRTLPEPTPQLANNLVIGAHKFDWGFRWGFAGRIDDVRVYSRALSSVEVQQLHQYEANPLPSLAVAVKTIRLNLFAEPGTTNQVESRTSLGNWTAYGPPFLATNSLSFVDVDVFGTDQRFFRVRRIIP
jgi:hypothetical protein